MFHLVLQRILHKKWMVASLLIGNILLIAIAVSHPMYQSATLRHLLTDGFTNSLDKTNEYPMMIRGTGRIRKEAGKAQMNSVRSFMDGLPQLMGVEAVEDVMYRNLVVSNATSLTIHNGADSTQKTSVASLRDIEAHASILSGRMYEPGIGNDGFIEAIISQSTMINLNFLVGEELEFENLKLASGDPVKIRIVGVFGAADMTDLYWTDSPDKYVEQVMIDWNLFEEQFMYKGATVYQVNEERLVLLDYSQVRPENVDRLITVSNDMVPANKTIYSSVEEPTYIPILENFRSEENRISVTLSILQVPVVVLLCAFIFMISRQMLEMEASEIALLKSRGASGKQVIRMYFLQSAILSGISFLVGLPLGSLICRVLGASSAFLQFNARRVLKVEYTGEVFLYGVAAVVLSMMLTLLPVFKKDKSSIVNVKRSKQRSGKPLWQKLYLDVIFVGVSLYGLYNFSQQQDEMLIRVLSGKSLDPLLFLSSSLFILGAGMLSLRIHGLIIKLIYTSGKKRWKPASYTAFLQLIRTRNKQAFIMVFLVLTVAFGLFNTTVARTIVANAENNLDYTSGADIVMTEYWKNNAAYLALDPNAEFVISEPDFAKYGEIPGIKSAAKVFMSPDASVKASSDKYTADVMAIDTKAFGETTDIRDGLLKYEYYDYLNVMSRNPNAVLLSANFRDKLGLKVGDTISVSMEGTYYSGTMNSVIYGFFDYWPGYSPTTITINEDESATREENYLVIAHLSTVQSAVGTYPYEVWINMGGNTDGFYQFVNDNDVKVTSLVDSVELKNDITTDPLFQGTNGILTMSFITILLICAIGYVIYWMLSIRSRELLFGIFRAMGMTRNEVIQMLINEQIFTGLFGIGFGLVIGWLASRLYVPIIQIAYSASDRVLPLELITESSDVARLIIIIAIMFIACLAILINQVFRMKISSALKLGED